MNLVVNKIQAGVIVDSDDDDNDDDYLDQKLFVWYSYGHALIY